MNGKGVGVEVVDAFLPKFDAVFWVFAVFFGLRFENQRWVCARQRGTMMGSNEAFGAFVDLTGGIAMAFTYVWAIAYGYDFGWQQAVGLCVVAWAASFVGCVVVGSLLGGDNGVVWIVATLTLWPLIAWLSFAVTWFGLIGQAS